MQLLRIAPRAKHFLWGSLFAQDAAYTPQLRDWLTRRGAACRRLLVAGQDEAACSELRGLDQVLLAVRNVDAGETARAPLGAYVSAHVPAIEIAEKRGCCAAAELLSAHDSVGRKIYQQGTVAMAAQALTCGDVEKAEQLYDAVLTWAPTGLEALAAAPRVEQFVRALFAQDSVRVITKQWTTEIRQVFQDKYYCQKTEIWPIKCEKNALAIDAQQHPMVMQRWLRLVLKFGMDTSRLSFGHADFPPRSNVRVWLDRGTIGGKDVNVPDPQAGENCTADARTSLLNLLRYHGAFAGLATSPAGLVDAKLVETVRSGLHDPSSHADLVAYLQQVRVRQPGAAERFLPLLLDRQAQASLPEQLKAWIKDGEALPGGLDAKS